MIDKEVLGKNIRIEEMKTGEINQVAIILTNAFETNPAYSLIFNRTGKLREGLLWLFKTNLFLINRRQTLTKVIKENDSNKITGTFTLIPPKGIKNTLSDYLHTGLFRFILQFGFRTLFKMLGMDSFNKNTLKNSVKAEKYYYLSMVAIKEEYRGKGIGSFAVKRCLDELSKTEKECRLVGLTTQLPENVAFYSRLGFETLDEGYVAFKKHKYSNWNMIYFF
ncbi:MAG: GNAT family N-acetyltransferase [Prevotellaceae bacterium]|jgi:ribosomal protein S18 acetylase RimI-like enzyme|nr:GNAT family N-acetyltransferase [Prevotellaceae bacterium]